MYVRQRSNDFDFSDGLPSSLSTFMCPAHFPPEQSWLTLNRVPTITRINLTQCGYDPGPTFIQTDLIIEQ